MDPVLSNAVCPHPFVPCPLRPSCRTRVTRILTPRPPSPRRRTATTVGLYFYFPYHHYYFLFSLLVFFPPAPPHSRSAPPRCAPWPPWRSTSTVLLASASYPSHQCLHMPHARGQPKAYVSLLTPPTLRSTTFPPPFPRSFTIIGAPSQSLPQGSS